MSLKWMTFVQLMHDMSSRVGDRYSLACLPKGEGVPDTLTYFELDRRAQKIAGYLREKGLVGERVLLLYPSSNEYIVAFLGCLYGGVIAVPAYPPKNNHHASRLSNIIVDADVKAVLTHSSLYEKIIEQVCAEMYVASDEIDGTYSAWRNDVILSSDVAYLQYTSGSTGAPKGVMVTHENILINCDLYSKGVSVGRGGHHVSWLPLFHDMGLVQGILLPLYLGATAVFMPSERFIQKPIRWLRAISDYKAVMTGGPNFAYDLCVKRILDKDREGLDLSGWQVAVNGAEPVSKATLDSFMAAYAPYGFSPGSFFPGYGMAETTLYVTAGNIEAVQPEITYIDKEVLKRYQVEVLLDGENPNAVPIVACGKIYSDLLIEIVNLDSLKRCLSNEIGEIWVSGDSVCLGYWGREKETVDAFKNYLSEYPGKFFLRTGDLGFIRNGQIYITGRLKDMIIIRGENHYPQDIEKTVEESHPALRIGGFGAAFSVLINGEENLVVVQEVERTQRNKVDIDDLRDAINRAVFSVHGLHAYSVLIVNPGEILKTSSGKIQRHACRKKYLNRLFKMAKGMSGVGGANSYSYDKK